MMRLRMPNGFTSAAQLRTIAEISRESGSDFADITTRQQVQLRGFGIEAVPEMWERLTAVGLGSLQTGMDNVRNVVGCPMAGLTPHELFDASPIAQAFTHLLVGNKAFTNLPRKFNVAITACLENCGHADAQDLVLTPAMQVDGREDSRGFNVAVGGKMGSGGCRLASPLDLFVRPEEAADVCAHVVEIFRDHGSRAARNRARLAFLLEDWGLARFRQELQRRAGRPLPAAGRDARLRRSTDHLGVGAQKQDGLSSVGLLVPVGRITVDQIFEVARLADAYGNGDVRITTAQNVIIPNVPNERLAALLAEPLLGELRPDPSGVMRGLVSCTGIDYCHFALIETKTIGLEIARHLEAKLPHAQPLSMHWSGCPAGCANHTTAAVGLLGKNIRRNGEVVDAVDVFVGGRSGANAATGSRILEDVPCDELPHVLEQLVPMLPYLSKRIGTPAPAGPKTAPAAEETHAHV
jgi:ferredoxin-nitrite reductase